MSKFFVAITKKENRLKLVVSIVSLVACVFLIISTINIFSHMEFYMYTAAEYSPNRITSLEFFINFTSHIIAFIFSLVLIIAINFLIWFHDRIFKGYTPEQLAEREQKRREKLEAKKITIEKRLEKKKASIDKKLNN